MAAGEEARRRCRICKREADIVALLAVRLGEALHAVHLGADILGDGAVECRLLRRELVLDGVGAALGKERPAVEAQQLLLGQAPHHVFGVGIVDAVAEPPLEAVAVEQRHEQLEVLFLAVVRRRRHQQQMPADLSELLPDLVALGVFDLAAEIGRRHAVGFIADDQVPFAAT